MTSASVWQWGFFIQSLIKSSQNCKQSSNCNDRASELRDGKRQKQNRSPVPVTPAANRCNNPVYESIIQKLYTTCDRTHLRANLKKIRSKYSNKKPEKSIDCSKLRSMFHETTRDWVRISKRVRKVTYRRIQT